MSAGEAHPGEAHPAQAHPGEAHPAEAHPAQAELLDGRTGPWEMMVGLEVHAQVASQSKLFSGAATAFGASPNTQVSAVDAALPGTLPVLNLFCVEQAVRTGLGLRARINLESRFDRKNYFYPDLPQGYQISQYRHPVVGAGEIIVDAPQGGGSGTVRVGIERLHLEQDAGKSLHDQDPGLSFVDLNRAGIALMEIVTHPDMRSAAQAQACVRKLRTILRYLGTCDGNMDEGSLRADANVSVRRPGADPGVRCEIKNLNSIRALGLAVNAEAQRQIAVLEDGGQVKQQTRLFDLRAGRTRAMRAKEDAHDYRYFPDPDLPPLHLEQAWVDGIAATLPELPDDKKERFMRVHGLSAYDAGVLVASPDSAAFFEETARRRDPRMAAHWITGEMFGALNKAGLDLAQSPVSAAALGELLDVLREGVISGRIAKDVFAIMFRTGKPPRDIIAQGGLEQVTDASVLEAAARKVIADNPDKAALAKTKPKILGWFVGQVMKATSGKANPQAVRELLARKLGV